ncbi:MAG: hypothetical protein DIU75_016390 [Mycolicibacterium hassiacum]
MLVSSSIPAVLAYLATHIPILPEIAEVKPKATLSIGWPKAKSDTMIVLAGTPDEDDQALTDQAYEGESGEEAHTITVTSTIWVRRTGEDGMLRAITDAYKILDAINGLVRSDRTLGRAVRPGLPARISTSSMSVTNSAQAAGEGRGCEVRWVLTWTHRE